MTTALICNWCGGPQPAYQEQGQGGLLFCHHGCRVAYYTGARQRRPFERDANVPLTHEEESAAFSFFTDGDELMRTHERQRSASLGIYLPQYPARRDILTALEGLHDRCAQEFGLHFVFPGQELDLDDARGETWTSILQYAATSPQRRASGNAQNMFLKFVPLMRLPEDLHRRVSMVKAVVDTLLTHRDDRKYRTVSDALDLRSVFELARTTAAEFHKTAHDMPQEVLAILLARAVSRLNVARFPNLAENFKEFLEIMEWNKDDNNQAARDVVAWLREEGKDRLEFDLDNYVSIFAHRENEEIINDLAASLRVTALTRSGISPGFTPLIDYFICNVNRVVHARSVRLMGRELVGRLGLFMVSELNNQTLEDFVHTFVGGIEHRADRTQSFLGMARAVLAHVLLALEAGQSRLGFVHYDLHLGNIMLKDMGGGGGGERVALQFRRPGEAPDVFVPLSSTRQKLVRIIDFGRARVEHPEPREQDAPATFAKLYPRFTSPTFDRAVDMRYFAFEFVRTALWGADLLEDLLAERDDDARAFLDVIDRMVGMHTWREFGFDGSRNIARMRPNEPMIQFREFVKRTRAETPEKVGFFRKWEIVRVRRDRSDDDSTPGDVLNMPFFREYGKPPDDAQTIDFIGDATRPLFEPRQDEGNGPEGVV